MTWFKTDFKGVRYRKHPSRKHGVQMDKYFVITYKFKKSTITEAIGWLSEGNKASTASELLSQLKRNQLTGTGPCTLAEMRALAEAEKKVTRIEAKRQDATLDEVWLEYIDARKHKWSERHLADHLEISRQGGENFKRGKGRLKAGPLAQLMPLNLTDLTPVRIEVWAKLEAAKRGARTRLAFSLLRAFINWCDQTPSYSGLVPTGACHTRIKREAIPRQKLRDDCLQREQLPSWFAAVLSLSNPIISAYLQTLLLTGARRNEIAGVLWEDLDFKWKSMTIRDKVEGIRAIPLTPYVATLLAPLPRLNQWVFSSPAAKSGRLQEPRIPHNKALAVAGIEGLTLHGLRRSFGTLSEWVEVPAGVVAQLMGHKPSATAEKHYKRRPLDLLRVWHEKIEAWILEQAGIDQPFAEHSGGKVLAMRK
ncbi:MAG: tyrosine-type recombinase/integrase [Proteobacteria bacterium]|nr:tyrosine-type recombinase/integrase [Pseudomonadota bacterium]MBU4470582.1 tyrosine-type recombinase/integrase [Pseudomonadota bacterium]MCG2751417.1 tyrosine-type recombinase/integrase [Desulfobacteraceae bacterium]